MDLDIECFQGNHWFWVIFLGLPVIILWGIYIYIYIYIIVIGLPLVGLFLLVKNRKHLQAFTNRVRYGFLFSGYEDAYFYWYPYILKLYREIVVIYRKALIAAAAVFLTTLPPIFQVCEYI